MDVVENIVENVIENIKVIPIQSDFQTENTSRYHRIIGWWLIAVNQWQ